VEVRKEGDPFEWNAMFDGTMFTNGSGTLSWARLLIAVREERNTYDRYAVAILEEDTCCSVGHLPREIGGLDFSRSSRTALRLFAGWLCRRGPANL